MAKILVVDDDEMNLMLTEMILSEMHYEVTTASSGEDCIAMLMREPQDLLLLDIEMQDMSGLKVLEQIREIPKIKETKTVFLTASSQMADKADAIRLGALDFIGKPAVAEDLIESVRKALLGRRKESILVVDDEPMNLMQTEALFGIRYDVRSASSGPEALELIAQEKPDMVLLDLHMPDMDGLEVLKRIHEMQGCENLPVVFLTADDDVDTEAKIFQAGAIDFIAKPFVMEVAIERIRRLLELKHLQDSLQEEVERKTAALVESNQKIRKLSDQVIRALAGAIDAKDSYTNGHSIRVAEYSRAIARRIGKTSAEAEEIYNIALLHDVGKIGISIEIINKPGKLTEEEYNIIKSHTTMGYNILSTISEMPALSIGARWHHERYDGKGYPDGIAGEEIPEIARIICVADCYDAMSSDRSYRKALPQHIVREEINRGKGTQFDPRIAEVMLQMIDEDKDYHMRGSKDGN